MSDAINPICNLSQKAVGGIVMGPRQTFHFNGPEVPIDDILSTMTGKKLIYIFGYFVYEDGERFSDKPLPKRFTKFCNIVFLSPGSDEKKILDGSIFPSQTMACDAEDWNCTDSGCKTVPKEAQASQ